MTEISIDRAPGRLAPIPRPAVMAADFTYLVLGLPLGIAAFTIAVTGLALGAGLLITLAGIPVLLATLLAVRAFAAAERKRAEWLLGTPIEGRERRLSGSAVGAHQGDRSATPPRGATRCTRSSCCRSASSASRVAVSLWATALGFLTSPAWYWAMPSATTRRSRCSTAPRSATRCCAS